MKLGMSEIMFDNMTINDSVAAAAKCGYDGIELRPKPNHLPASLSAEEVREIRKKIDDAGLETHCIAGFNGYYAGLDDDECRKELDELKHFLEFAGVLGCGAIRHWTGRMSSRDMNDDQRARAREWMNKALEVAAEADVTLVLELHHRTPIDSIDAAVSFVESLDKKNCMIIHDAANLYQEGVEYGRDAIKKLKGHLFELHVKDIVEVVDDSHPEATEPYLGRRFINRPINMGGIDQYSIFAGIRDIGFNGYVTVESGWLTSMDANEVARYSIEQMRKVMSDLEREGQS